MIEFFGKNFGQGPENLEDDKRVEKEIPIPEHVPEEEQIPEQFIPDSIPEQVLTSESLEGKKKKKKRKKKSLLTKIFKGL